MEIKSNQLSSLLVVCSYLIVANRRKKVFSPKCIKCESTVIDPGEQQKRMWPVFKEFTIDWEIQRNRQM